MNADVAQMNVPQGSVTPPRCFHGDEMHGAAVRSSALHLRSSAFTRLLACLVALSLVSVVEAADPRKVVRTSYPSAENKLDPQAESDEASAAISAAIFDSLLEYDYLARPAKLKARAAAALPEVNAAGTVYTLKVKPGIYFTPDPAFKGARRELTAADFVYSIKRLLDPKLRSQRLFLVERKIKGADALMAEAKKTGRFDYDRPIAGLRALDRYTLRIELNNTDYGFAFVLAMPATSAVAREVRELYGEDFHAHPVGTGPFFVRQWLRGSRIVLEANPGYREEFFESAGGDDEPSRQIAANLRGKRLPLVGRVEIYVIDEAQPRWLAFLNGEHDYIRPLPEEFAQLAMPGGELAPNLKKMGLTVTPDEIAYTTYVTFPKPEKLPELRKQAQLGKVQSFSYGWIADYPDGENFLQLLWKGSIGQTNYAMFDLPEYNALYERAKLMPDGPQRHALYERMVKLIMVYVPWMVETYKAQNIVLQPWLLNYKKHPFGLESWLYLDIDLERQARH